MFRTIDSDLIGVPGIFGQGVSHWRGVSRLLRTPWYHLTLSVVNEGRLSECSVMIDDTRQLQELLVNQGTDLAITEIMAVTPSWMNKTGGWQMERLTRLAVGEDKIGSEVCLLEVAKGAVYHTSHQQGFEIEALANLRPIFLSNMIQGH
ncbi:hypothetical protein ALP63_101986 [Pseudomonas syringae pv. aceris]|uniref:Uncharacterized protein n=2 Tax=Pseudomonas TaxID=286 RepID=A0AAE6QHN6_9PSED|nr:MULTISPECIES: hypothetical protein [Pseudomonas syringae group]MEE5168804.1 hypothetical protein [Pseudomonas alliivorans]QGT82053.1 hypothetical protein GMO17_13065 [Pseudomonas coronafaciens pv. coronafaciens]QIQ69835.1 hypothetical protein HBB04_00176 [Pseudomonas coronafaciens]RMS58520.1 hypothetical protein ALP63_101986 [Pseudomonas syringae pv. aceris]RMS69131.1 hypothetical protein ALP62_101954 [Pseudomonas syringae pv. aceris]